MACKVKFFLFVVCVFTGWQHVASEVSLNTVNFHRNAPSFPGDRSNTLKEVRKSPGNVRLGGRALAEIHSGGHTDDREPSFDSNDEAAARALASVGRKKTRSLNHGEIPLPKRFRPNEFVADPDTSVKQAEAVVGRDEKKLSREPVRRTDKSSKRLERSSRKAKVLANQRLQDFIDDDTWRTSVKENDVPAVHDLLQSENLFQSDQLLAEELYREALHRAYWLADFELLKVMTPYRLLSSLEFDNRQLMKIAIDSDDKGFIQAMIAAGADINSEYEEMTPLYRAGALEHIDLIRLLCRYKPNASIASSRGKPPLHVAVERNRLDVVKDLLKLGANVNERFEGVTALQIAEAKGFMDINKILLGVYNRIATLDTSGAFTDKSTALNEQVLLGAETGSAGINQNSMVALEGSKLTVNQPSTSKESQTSYDFEIGQEIFGMPIFGFDVQKDVNEHLWTDVDMAGMNEGGYVTGGFSATGLDDSTTELNAAGDISQRLSQAIRRADTALIHQLLEENNIFVTAPDDAMMEFQDAVWLAYSTSNFNVVKILIGYIMASPPPGIEGLLMKLTVDSGDETLLLYMEAWGADLNESFEGMTPLYRAASNQNLAVVKLLLQLGADPSIHSEGLKPPLLLALEKGDLEVFQLLLAKGADASITHEGRSTIEAATTSKDQKFLDCLTKHNWKGQSIARASKPVVFEFLDGSDDSDGGEAAINSPKVWRSSSDDEGAFIYDPNDLSSDEEMEDVTEVHPFASDIQPRQSPVRLALTNASAASPGVDIILDEVRQDVLDFLMVGSTDQLGTPVAPVGQSELWGYDDVEHLRTMDQIVRETLRSGTTEELLAYLEAFGVRENHHNFLEMYIEEAMQSDLQSSQRCQEILDTLLKYANPQ